MDDDIAHRLTSADRSARQMSARPADATTEPCPADKLLYSVIVKLLGETDAPVADAAFELRRGDGGCLYGKTDQQGEIRFDRLPAGSYQLTPYLLDQDAWEFLRSEPGDEAGIAGLEEALWGAPVKPASQAFVHQVQQGECTAKLADRFGFAPDTVWNWSGNAALRALRIDRNILAPGDHLAFPPLRIGSLTASTGKRQMLRRKGVPDTIRIRFLSDGVARAGVPFIASMNSPDGQPAPDIAGNTGPDGFVVLSVMPGVTQVAIRLDTGDENETHIFDIGHIDPAPLRDGTRERLQNLGFFDPGAPPDSADAFTDALIAFQLAGGLPASGVPDAATLQQLQDRHLS